LRAHLTVQGEVTTALAASEAQFRKIADGLPQLIYLTDETGQVRLTNERWREFTGIEPSAVRRGDEDSFVHPDDLAGTLDAWNTALSANRPYERELRIRRRDGEYVWHLSRAAPLIDSVSGETLWLGSMTDIDERRRQEAKVRESEARVRELHRSLEERAAELTAVNRELEAFSYSVSHDLRAPLRHIDGFTTLLEKQLHGTLDEKALRYMRTIREATRDLGRLIDDLLDYSRLGRQSLRTTRVAPGELVREAAEVAERAEPGRRIEWKIGPLPDVEADRTLLRVALDNLLGNAVKYTRPRELATITVDAAESEDGTRTIRVSDNGVGFDMRYASKLFGVFQRLHSEAEFEGTGIGLATVQRVVHRMGGRVRGEGSPGVGATFFLTLPAPHQEER
jgi:PAS domain S-box-containing protein